MIHYKTKSINDLPFQPPFHFAISALFRSQVSPHSIEPNHRPSPSNRCHKSDIHVEMPIVTYRIIHKVVNLLSIEYFPLEDELQSMISSVVDMHRSPFQP